MPGIRQRAEAGCRGPRRYVRSPRRRWRHLGSAGGEAEGGVGARAACLYFDVSFMIWVILGPLGPFLGESLKLSAAQKGLLTAVPLLGGSFFRPILGWMTERFGGRRTGRIGLAVSLIPLLLGWQFARSFN